jgi:hypothetical protein
VRSVPASAFNLDSFHFIDVTDAELLFMNFFPVNSTKLKKCRYAT